MNISEYFLQVMNYFVFVPATVLCYMPMINQLKYSKRKTYLCIIICAFAAIFIMPLLHALLQCEEQYIWVLIVIFFFGVYLFMVKTDIFRSLAVFTLSCVLSSFPPLYAYIFDAWFYPDGNFLEFKGHIVSVVFRIAIAVMLALLASYPLHRWGSQLVDMINNSKIWLSIEFISIMFLILNLSIIPDKYSTIHIGRLFSLIIIVVSISLLLSLFIYVVFYFIAMEIQKNADLKQRLRFFEMQESQYIKQKSYIDATSKQRHDFRQSIFTLKQLAEEENLDSLKRYLSEYVKTLPKLEIYPYCKHSAVNALLNYYAQSAAENDVRIEWSIELPDVLRISEPDFCSLLGNMIENAISGCLTIEDSTKRYYCLSITVKDNVNMYIVSTNSFNGVVKYKDEQYLSTKRKGSGMGIHSIKMIAEKYNGIARFSHTSNEFFADAALNLSNSDTDISNIQ